MYCIIIKWSADDLIIIRRDTIGQNIIDSPVLVTLSTGRLQYGRIRASTIMHIITNNIVKNEHRTIKRNEITLCVYTGAYLYIILFYV